MMVLEKKTGNESGENHPTLPFFPSWLGEGQALAGGCGCPSLYLLLVPLKLRAGTVCFRVLSAHRTAPVQHECSWAVQLGSPTLTASQAAGAFLRKGGGTWVWLRSEKEGFGPLICKPNLHSKSSRRFLQAAP